MANTMMEAFAEPKPLKSRPKRMRCKKCKSLHIHLDDRGVCGLCNIGLWTKKVHRHVSRTHRRIHRRR